MAKPPIFSIRVFLPVFLSALILFLYARCAYAIPTTMEVSKEIAAELKTFPQKEAWLKKFNRQREEFAEKYGTRFAFVFNYAQQVILRDKHDAGKSRSLWYGNFAIGQKLWQDAEMTAEFEVDKNKGVDKFIPTYAGFNSNSGDNASLYIPSLYIEQKLFEDKVFITGGKLDLSNWFDTNNVANSADVQFLSEALINSYTIPFPAKGIGAMVKFQPYDWLYLQSGVATAKAVSTKTGLSDAFNSELFIGEFGLSPKLGKLKGNYRFIPYLLHSRSERIMDDSESKNEQFGFSLSFDQAVTERITLFLRYGFADQKFNAVAHAWSGGGQITEPIRGRKYDYCGLGIAQNILGRDFRAYNGADTLSTRETMLEAYYSVFLTEFLMLTSDLQVVLEPDADKSATNPVVGTIRLLVTF